MEYNVNYDEFIIYENLDSLQHRVMASSGECWYCLINGKMFEGKGSKTMGKSGWTSRRGLLQAFYNSVFWDAIVSYTLKANKINRETYPNWKDRMKAEKKIKKELLKHMLDTKAIEFKCISTNE